MAPKRAVAKRVRTGKQSRGNLTPSRIENWEKNPNNRYLFRNAEAYRRYAGSFAQRPVSDCYRFVMQEGFMDIHRNFIKEHLDFWELQGLAFTSAPYTEDTTRIFYSNLEFDTDEDDGDRFLASGYLFGREFEFDSTKLNEYLGRADEGQLINKKWPRQFGTFEDYHQWFGCWRNQKIGSLSSTELPALHRVLFMIINNILIPKRMIKTNVEMSGVFFLRHWLQKDLKINVGAIMLEHMSKVANSAKDSLPYAAFISAHLIPEAMDSYKEHDTLEPVNLANLLTSYGWIENNEMLEPNPDDLKNRYILQSGAAPNQYVPVGEPLPNMPFSGASSSSSAPNPSNQELMEFLTDQFNAINTNIAGLQTNIAGLQTNFAGFETRLQTMQNDAQQNFARFDDRFTSVENRLNDMDLNLHNFWGSMEAKLKGKDDTDDGEE